MCNALKTLIVDYSIVIDEEKYADSFGALAKELRQSVDDRLAEGACSLHPLYAPSDSPPIIDYMYFCLPLTDLKLAMYRKVFQSEAKSLSGKAKAKITPFLEHLTDELQFIKLNIPPAALKEHGLYTVYKVDRKAPVCCGIIDSQRRKTPDEEHKIAYVSTIAGKPFNNLYSKNEKHPRVFNMFTSMSSSLRHHSFKSVYKVDMVEVDFTNSVIQCLAKKANSQKILNAIETNTLLTTRKSKRREQKRLLLSSMFSVLSENVTDAYKKKQVNKLRNFLMERINDENEVRSFVRALCELESPHELFHYEDILRDFCREHPVCINVHDAVYIPASETSIIKELTDELDRQKYLYKITKH